MQSQSKLVDYHQEFPHAIFAQGEGHDFMALFKLSEPLRRKDGQKAKYELLHRWYKWPCRVSDDLDVNSVMGTHRTYLAPAEVDPLLNLMQRQDVSLNSLFGLF